jgi:hypothetical protein
MLLWLPIQAHLIHKSRAGCFLSVGIRGKGRSGNISFPEITFASKSSGKIQDMSLRTLGPLESALTYCQKIKGRASERATFCIYTIWEASRREGNYFVYM